jgi:phosphotransferase system enzyme I (PtsI)
MALKGNPVSSGLAYGKLLVYSPFNPGASENFCTKENTAAHVKKYAAIKDKAALEIEKIFIALENDPEKAKIFTAHRDILNDPAIHEEIIEGIESDLFGGDWAIWKAYAKFIKLIGKAKDPMIRERSADFEDVRKRLIRIWNGIEESSLADLGEPFIIAAKELLPSDTATIDRKNVLGIITETGGSTSHSAIIARSYGIPAILGIEGLLEKIRAATPGTERTDMSDAPEAACVTAALDAVSGEVNLNPDAAFIAAFAEKQKRFRAGQEAVRAFLDTEACTKDGERISIGLNIGGLNEEELSGAAYTDFAGLFRTEFLYMGKSCLPDEEEQFAVYRKVLESYGGKPVYIRTLDIGGDKTLSYMELPKEANPFLGKRALRLCFGYPEIFKTQLRAALRASVYGNLYLMLPMVASLDDVRKAKAIIAGVRKELDAEKISYGDYKLGIMIEIPSAALIADMLAKEVDFASIGTNDLCQYLNAADRMNPELNDYYQTYHPAMFRLIGYAAEQFNKAGKPLSICGEMGGDTLAAPALIGLGVKRLSMSLSSVAAMKKIISETSIGAAAEIAEKVKHCETAADAEKILTSFLAG